MGLFCQYDSFEGSATAEGYEKWVQAKEVNAASSRTSLAGQTGASAQQRMTGTSQVGPITIRQDLDKSFPKILEAMLGGKLNKKIKLVETQTVGGKQATICEYTFEDNLFTSVRQESDGTGKSVVVVEFQPLKLEVKFTEYDPKDGSKKGDVAGKYDGGTQKAG
jgi:type VI protein secretion system component Hcp